MKHFIGVDIGTSGTKAVLLMKGTQIVTIKFGIRCIDHRLSGRNKIRMIILMQPLHVLKT